jgi:hypothetical protein
MKASALLVIAGIATAADAQDLLTYSWVLDNGGVIEDGGTGTGTLWGLMEPQEVALAGSTFDISIGANGGDGAGTFDLNSLLSFLSAQHYDYSGGGVIAQVEAFQLPMAFNVDHDTGNPVRIGTLSFTPNSYDPHEVAIVTFNHLNNWVYEDTFGTVREYAAIDVGATFHVVPAPASLAILGLGGLLARRRRG